MEERKKRLNKWKNYFINNFSLIYSILLVIYICSMIVTSEFVYANFIVRFPFSIIKYIIVLICILKIFLTDLNKYSGKGFVKCVFLLILLVIISFITRNRSLLQLFIIILASYGVDFKLVMKNVLFSQTIFLVIIILFSVLGILPNREFGRIEDEVTRYSLGFKFSTYSSLFTWSLTTLYLYYRKDKLTNLEYISLFVINLIFYLITDTRMEFFCSFVTLLVFYLHQKGRLFFLSKIVNFMAEYLMIILTILSLFLVVVYDGNNRIMAKLDSVMSGRLELNQEGYRKYGINLFGNYIEWVGLSQVYENSANRSDYNYIDSSYLNILYQYGVIVLFIVIIAFYQLAYMAIRSKDYYLQYVIILLAIHSFINPQLLSISYNLFLLLLVYVLFPMPKIKEKEEEGLSLKEIQDLEFKMFRDVVKFLEKNNLTYFICGGTLLGAIRHHGFIPWDDDIDILMPRPDYEKLQQIAKTKKISEELEIHSFELKNLNDPFCKVFNLNTRMNKYNLNDEYDRYMWIDIFPLDGLPDSDKKIKKIFKKSIFWRKLLIIRKLKDEKVIDTSKTKLKALFKPFVKFFVDFLPTEFYVKKIRKLCLKYSYYDAKYVGGIAWGYGAEEKMKKEDVLKTVDVDFLDLKVKTFSCWDLYLRNLYGDYWKIPEENERKAHKMVVQLIDEK